MQKPANYPLYQTKVVPQRRQPPPYPGSHRQYPNASAYRQSYASSEAGSTDISLSSSENLCTSLRQEPQGEETSSSVLSSPADAPTYGILMQGTSALQVKSAHSSTVYMTDNMNTQQEEMNMRSYTILPQMPLFNAGAEHFNSGALAPHQFVQAGPVSQAPEQPHTAFSNYNESTDVTAFSQRLDVTQMNTHASGLQSPTPSTPEHNGPAPSFSANTLHGAYANIYCNASFESPSSPAPFPYLPPAIVDPRQYPVMQHTSHQHAADAMLQQRDTSRPNSALNSQSNQVISKTNQSQNISLSAQERPLDSDSKQDPYKKWRHYYVNQKSQLNQYKLFNQSAEGQTEGAKPDRGQSNALSKSKSGSYINKQPFEGVSNVRATDRLRSATPDILSDRPTVARQLPMRPSSANSKQQQQAPRQERLISFTQLKQQKLAKISAHQNTKPNNKKGLFENNKDDSLSTISTMSTSSSEFDNGIKGFRHPRTPPGFTAALDKFTSSGHRMLSEQRQLLRSPPQTRSGRQQRPRTAPPQRSPVTLKSPFFQAAPQQPVLNAQLKDSQHKELSRSCEMLNKLHTVSSPVSNERILDEHQGELGCLYEGKDSKLAGTDGQDSRLKLGNSEVDHAAIATRATHMVEKLSEENQSLRHDIERYKLKVIKLEKFEGELKKVSDEHCKLMQDSEKQQSLEKVMRFKLNCQINTLKDTNKQLKDQLEKRESAGVSLGATAACDAPVRQELKEKETMLGKLILQHRNLAKVKDKVDMELAAEKVRNDERQKHVIMCETALKSSQAQVCILEEENNRLKMSESKNEQLQSAVTQLQASAEKRQAIEMKLRHKLEEEIRFLKHNRVRGKASDTDEGISSDSECPTRVNSLLRQLQARESELARVEWQAAHWQQKYHEQYALSILALDAASKPKDARIAALEMNCHDTGRLIEESRTDRLKHLQEVYQAKKSTTELEAKVKTLELQLAERDAMVRVLNRHTSSLSRTSSINSLFSSPIHSPLPSCSSSAPLPALSSYSSSHKVSHAAVSVPLTPQLQHRDISKLVSHTKSNSDGAVLDLTAFTSASCSGDTVTTGTPSVQDNSKLRISDLHKKLAQQAMIFKTWQKEEPDDIKKELYQV